jgi:hypothetical protein
MNSTSIRDQLFQNNPFVSGSATDPWENDDPDVLSLNQNAYEHICGLIRTKNRGLLRTENQKTQESKSQKSFAGLILGESGAGKTHFLKRLLNYTQQNDIAAIFVSVKPLLNPKKPMRHLLREIVVNLSRVQVPEENLDSFTEKRKAIPQFEYFVAKIMQRYQKDKLGFDLQQAIDYFKNYYRSRGISENLLKAVFSYRDPDKQNLILNWLEGGIDEDQVAILKFPDREVMDDLELEAEAHDIILSLGMLLEYCEMPMVICFDQLDGMREHRLIRAFGDIIHFLVNEVPNVLPLAFVRSNTWTERFSSLDTAVIERLSNNTNFLQGCTISQAQDLIKMRIELRFKEDSEEKFQWLMEQLKGKLKEGYMPRRVIELANDAIVHPLEGKLSEIYSPYTPTGIVEIFASEYQRIRNKVLGDLEVWPPDAERLLKALSAYLASRSEYGELRSGDDRFIALTGKYQKPGDGQVDCAFILNTADHHKTAQAAFERGVKFLQAHPGGSCYYITDKRCNFKTSWKKVHEAKSKFEALQGISLFLEQSQAIDWYGLTSLIFKLEAGDILLPPSMGFRPATAEDFALYMKEGFDRNRNFLAFPPPPPPPPPLYKEKIVEILKTSPIGFMALSFLRSELEKNGAAIDHDRLLEFIKKCSDSFILHESTDDNIVMLKS